MIPFRRTKTSTEPLRGKARWKALAKKLTRWTGFFFAVLMFFGFLAIWTDDPTSRFENTAALMLLPVFVFGVGALAFFLASLDEW